MNDMMQQFFTREKANDGAKMPLQLPDGTETKYWLLVRGIDSDAFRKANAAANQRLLHITEEEEKDPGKVEAIKEECKLSLIVALIAGWSFDMPCTEENVASFLKEAPYIRDGVDRFAANRKLFFKMQSEDSANSQKQNSH